jgi:hypothetical protein
MRHSGKIVGVIGIEFCVKSKLDTVSLVNIIDTKGGCFLFMVTNKICKEFLTSTEFLARGYTFYKTPQKIQDKVMQICAAQSL